MNVYETIEEVFGLDKEDEDCEPTTEEIEEDILDPCRSCPGCDI